MRMKKLNVMMIMNVVQCVGELAAYEEYADTGTLPTLQPPPRHTTLH